MCFHRNEQNCENVIKLDNITSNLSYYPFIFRLSERVSIGKRRLGFSLLNRQFLILQKTVPGIVKKDLDLVLCGPWLKCLTHSNPLIFSYTPWKHQKTSGFLMFSGSIETKHWRKMRGAMLIHVVPMLPEYGKALKYMGQSIQEWTT